MERHWLLDVSVIGFRKRMRRHVTAWVAMGSGAVCVGLSVGGANAIKMSDQATTAGYLHAAYVLARSESARVAASTKAIEAEATEIMHGCPSALAQAPKGKQLAELGSEVSAALFFAGTKPDVEAMRTFAARVAGLHWSNDRLTALVRSLAVEERGAAKLHLPAVCVDIKVWVASGYRTLPETTVRFIKRLEALNGMKVDEKAESESQEERILRLLAPRESVSERRVAQRVERLEEATTGQITHEFLMAFASVTETLGVKSS